MKAFISYSFADPEKLDELSHILEERGIPFFRTSEMVAGRSLADQVRDSIVECAICIFIATHNSVASAWCGAELGAFWGAGKVVIIYLADSSLREEQLPKQFQGQLLERNMFRVADAAKTHLDRVEPNSGSKSVATLSVPEMRALIQESIRLANARLLTADLLVDVASFFANNRDRTDTGRPGRARSLLRGLLGLTLADTLNAGTAGWNYSFKAATTTGVWTGFGLKEETHADGFLDLYRDCVLLRLDDQRTIIGAALTETVTLAHRALGLSSWTKNVLAAVGQAELGDAIPENW